MTVTDYLAQIGETFLLIPTSLLCVVGLIVTLKSRFIQLRAIPRMFRDLARGLSGKNKRGNSHTIDAHKALFTTMSTTIGTATITSPIVAIKLGGPGALVGFLIATILGGALSYIEVTLALQHRKKLSDGTIMGGPMQYLKNGLHTLFASWYAYAGFVLLLVWTTRQANTLADVLEPYAIPSPITGVLLAGLVLFALRGGIKKVGDISAQIVPLMFVLYTAAVLWIIVLNVSNLPCILALVFENAFSARPFAIGGLLGGLTHVLRYGVIQGMQTNEAGIGTSTIAHSMAAVNDPKQQGILSIVSIYSTGFLCILSGLVTLLTGTWQDPSISFGINIMSHSFGMYFSFFGPLILAISTILFAYGTILGNCYNASQCFTYITKNKYTGSYQGLVALCIFLGAILDVKALWIITDFFFMPVALTNILAILILSFKSKKVLED